MSLKVVPEVRGGPQSAEALDLLAELLGAFGIDRARAALPRGGALARKQKDATIGTESPRRNVRDRLVMLPVLRELVAEVRALRSGPLQNPEDYRRRWRAIIARWNESLYDAGAVTLPPLCEVCGVPVLARRLEKDGARVEPPTVCSERCRSVRKARRARAR